jgi:hypothetical protein
MWQQVGPHIFSDSKQKAVDNSGDRLERGKNHDMGGKRIKCNNKVGF